MTYSKHGLRPAGIWLFLSALLPFVFFTGCNRQAPAEAPKNSGPIPVRSAPVALKRVERDVVAVGTMFPYEEVVISSEIEGRVVEVTADLGDRVTQNQILVRVSDEEQRYLLQQNEAQLRQSLERLGLGHENDKLRDINLAPEVKRARAELFDAEQRYRRTKELVDQRIASRQDLDQAEARFHSLQASLDATLNQTRNLVQEIERYRAQLSLQRKKLRDTNIRAPFVSYVKERSVNVGQYVRPNTPVFTLVKTDPIRLRIEVPERMAPWVKNQQKAEVSVEAFPDRMFNGKVWRISPTVEQSKRTFVVEALIANPSGELKPGSYARARIGTDKTDEIKLIPFRGINYVFGTNKAYIIQNGVIDAREVKLGDRFGDDVEVVEGVKQGEIVAVSQLARLETGSRVQIAAAGSKGGSKKAE